MRKKVFQAKGAAYAKALRREGAWYNLGTETTSGMHGARQETRLEEQAGSYKG